MYRFMRTMHSSSSQWQHCHPQYLPALPLCLLASISASSIRSIVCT